MFNSRINESKICTVLFTVFFFFSFNNCIYTVLFPFCRWVLILFQSLEYAPFVYVLRKDQNIALFRKKSGHADLIKTNKITWKLLNNPQNIELNSSINISIWCAEATKPQQVKSPFSIKSKQIILTNQFPGRQLSKLAKKQRG